MNPNGYCFFASSYIICFLCFLPEEYRHIYLVFGWLVELGLQPIVLNITLKRDVIGIIMWVINFDRVSQKTEVNETTIMGWGYFHLLLPITIITTGVATMLLIEQSNFRDNRINILLFGSLAIFTLSILSFRYYLSEKKN